jgi:hypothetical protein
MKFKLVAMFESGPTCEVTDPVTRGAAARWFQEIAAAAAADCAAEAPVKRGPGRPPKSSAPQAALPNGSEEQPQVAAAQ